MTDQPTTSARTRLSVLAAAAAAGVAAVTSAVAAAPGVRAANDDVVRVGSWYYRTADTVITTAGATALTGISDDHNGVSGQSTGANGVYGYSAQDVGVYGNTDADAGYGVVGHSGLASTGVAGLSAMGTGVLGITGSLAAKPTSLKDTGVYGYAAASATSIGVRGGSPAGTGVLAESTSGTALKVNGKATFSRGKRVAIASGQASLKVTMAGVTTSSYVIATLQGNRAGIWVQAVVTASGSFTIYLNKAVPATTSVGYLVVN